MSKHSIHCLNDELFEWVTKNADWDTLRSWAATVLKAFEESFLEVAIQSGEALDPEHWGRQLGMEYRIANNAVKTVPLATALIVGYPLYAQIASVPRASVIATYANRFVQIVWEYGQPK